MAGKKKMPVMRKKRNVKPVKTKRPKMAKPKAPKTKIKRAGKKK